jgi:hypothetical protein
MDTLSHFERAVLEKACEGAHPVLLALRNQVHHVRVTARSFTGVGFFTDLKVTGHGRSLAVGERFGVIDDIIGSIHTLHYGAGFVVSVEHGLLSALEGYSHGEVWPDGAVTEFELGFRGSPRELPAIVEEPRN